MNATSSPVDELLNPGESASRPVRILAAAGRMFIEHGYEGASMEEIAKAAAVTRQTLYNRFPEGKESLFVAVAERMWKAFPAMHVPTDERALADPRNGLMQIATEFACFWSGPTAADFLRMVFMEGRRFPVLAYRFDEVIQGPAMAAISDYLAELARRGILSVQVPEADARYFMQTLDGGVLKNVHDFIRSYVNPGDVLVVGVSGGGDSNSLLLGLTSFTDFSFDVRPVILKGIPDWDAGVPRALELCKSYGLHLTVVEEEEVRQISKLKDSSNIIGQYESIFPGDDFEFLGTYMIRKVLMHIASSCNGRAVTGLNLEDVFAESLLMISNKRLPLPFPVRKIDGIDFIYPLWLCPKKIIDGCFPKFSMENYEMRYPCFSTGRNLYYMMTYTLQSMYPGALENLLRGFQNISQNNEHGFMSDPDFGSSLNGEIENNIREKFLKIMLP